MKCILCHAAALQGSSMCRHHFELAQSPQATALDAHGNTFETITTHQGPPIHHPGVIDVIFQKNSDKPESPTSSSRSVAREYPVTTSFYVNRTIRSVADLTPDERAIVEDMQ